MVLFQFSLSCQFVREEDITNLVPVEKEDGETKAFRNAVLKEMQWFKEAKIFRGLVWACDNSSIR
jgi:hypothetical protein